MFICGEHYRVTIGVQAAGFVLRHLDKIHKLDKVVNAMPAGGSALV
jgi:hypothetical protein